MIHPPKKDGWLLQSDRNTGLPDFAALAVEIHTDNVSAGWWTDLLSGASILAARNRPEMLMLAVSELAEAYDGVINGCDDDKLPHLPMFDVELADFAIRQLDQVGAEVACGATMPQFEFGTRLPSGLSMRSRGEQLMHLVAVVSAAMEHYRKGRIQQYVDSMAYGIDQVFALARLHLIDLVDVINQKRAFNRVRADHKPESRKADGGKAF